MESSLISKGDLEDPFEVDMSYNENRICEPKRIFRMKCPISRTNLFKHSLWFKKLNLWKCVSCRAGKRWLLLGGVRFWEPNSRPFPYILNLVKNSKNMMESMKILEIWSSEGMNPWRNGPISRTNLKVSNVWNTERSPKNLMEVSEIAEF